MRTVTTAFRTEMVKQTLNNLYRRFIYNSADRSNDPDDWGSIILDAKQIISGSANIDLINSTRLPTDRYWNMFLANHALLRQEATVELGIQVAGSPEYMTFFTGFGDQTRFITDHLNLQLRDKMIKVLEQQVGTTTTPVAYAAQNPADLAYAVLVTNGPLVATDINAAIWAQWKTDCASVNLSLKASFTGQTILWILNQIAFLSGSIIFVRGDGQFVFFRFAPAPTIAFHFTDHNTYNAQVWHTFDNLVNDVSCEYGWDGANWDGGGPATATDPTGNSQANYGQVVIVEQDTNLWHDDAVSAKEFAERLVQRFKDPQEYYGFETGLMGFIFEPSDIIYVTNNFFGYSSTVFQIHKVRFDLNKGIAYIEAVNASTWGLGGFVLDHAFLGLLDKDYNPLF